MKKLLIVLFFILGITFLSNGQFSAQAGRTQQNFGGSYCEYSCPGVPCYDEVTQQQLPASSDPGLQCGSNRSTSQPKEYNEFGSVVLLAFAAYFLLKRLI